MIMWCLIKSPNKYTEVSTILYITEFCYILSLCSVILLQKFYILDDSFVLSKLNNTYFHSATLTKEMSCIISNSFHQKIIMENNDNQMIIIKKKCKINSIMPWWAFESACANVRVNHLPRWKILLSRQFLYSLSMRWMNLHF